MARRPSVLVTGLGSYGEQILKALKHRDATACRVVGVDIDPYCIHFGMADVAVAAPRADAPDFLEAISHICQQFDVEAIYPGCEPDLDQLVFGRESFERRGIRIMAAPEAILKICRDKLATCEALRTLGFEPPCFTTLKDPADAATIAWYPVVVKPRHASGGSKDCYIAQNARQLALLWELGGGADLFVQEYVGTPDAEFTVGVLFDLDGNLLNSIALQRDLMSQLNLRLAVPNKTDDARFGSRLVISSGVSQGRIDAFPEVTEPCEKIALAIGATGSINIQCRLVDGQIKVFEINPRFSGTTFIRAMMGYNEPEVLMRLHLLNQAIEPHFPYRHGHVVRSLRETLVASTPAASWRRS